MSDDLPKISNQGQEILHISSVGRVTFSSHLHPDEAAKEAWAALMSIAAGHNTAIVTRAEAEAMVAAERAACTEELRLAVDAVREQCAKMASDQAQVFRDEAHDQMQLGHREMHKRAKMIATFFDAHAAAIRAGKEKP